ncbi:MAG: type II toxin-antitoxin system TacA family antitoxin [Pseudonocardiales bacterium]
MTDFVLESAMSEAKRVLADRHWFLIDDERWGEFQPLLEQPPRDLPKLRALLVQPAPFADEGVGVAGKSAPLACAGRERGEFSSI